MSDRRRHIAAMRFNHWLVLEFSHVNASGRAYWHCLCDCGNEAITAGSYLWNGESTRCRSCRAQRAAEANLRHGQIQHEQIRSDSRVCCLGEHDFSLRAGDLCRIRTIRRPWHLNMRALAQ